MFRNNLLKLSMTLVLLVAISVVSVSAVAAAGSGTIIQVKGASDSAALGGTADTSDWYGRHPELVTERGADLSDYFQRHLDINISTSLLDNPNNQRIGPETVSAALGQMAAPALAIGRGPYSSPRAAPALAIGRGPYSSPRAAPALAFGRGPYSSPRTAPVSMRSQNSDAPGR